MACIKTGVVLKKRNDDSGGHWLSDNGGHLDTLYGDLHLVGGACILHYPPNQVPWGTSHGWIDLDWGDNLFQRKCLPHHILVVPASRVVLREAAIHEWDRALFVAAGGMIDKTPGEQG